MHANAYARTQRDHSFARLNAGRKLASVLRPLTMADEPVLRANGFKQPISTLADYQKQLGATGELMDADKEPFLVLKLALECGMHPLIPVFDIGESVRSGTGKRDGHVELISTSVPRGDALLRTDTLVLWC
jgi:hypothetical protein